MKKSPSLPSLVLLSLLAVPSLSSAAVVAQWSFNDGSGTTATDTLGLSNGTLTDFADTSAGAGDAGDSGWTSAGQLEFDGTNEFVSTPFSLGSLIGKSFTFETIVSHDNVSQTWSPILGQSNIGQGGIFFFGKRAEQDEIHINIAGFGSDNTGLSFADGQIHHLGLVFDDAADTITVFVDSVQGYQRTGVTGTLTATSNLLIGGVSHNGAERWNGLADQVRISDTALLPAEFIPEPSTGLLVLSGLLGFATRRRRQA